MKSKSFLTKAVEILSVILVISIFIGCGDVSKDVNQEFKEFLKEFEAKFIPLDKNIRLAEYNSAISGSETDFKRSTELNIKLTEIYANKEDYNKLKKIKESGEITDPLLQRQLEEIYNEYKFHQVSKEKMAVMIKEGKEIERKFTVYRSELGEKKLSVNDIEEILTSSKDSRELKKVWEASKQVGALIADDLIRLVKMRNEAARTVGFHNYHEMRLTLSGQDPKKVESIFNDLDLLTKHPYAELKYSIDDILAERFDIEPNDLRPWHYQNRFFQEAPNIYPVDLDGYYENKDVVPIAQTFYEGVGFEVADILENSDLYEKPVQHLHLFRVLQCNYPCVGNLLVLSIPKYICHIQY